MPLSVSTNSVRTVTHQPVSSVETTDELGDTLPASVEPSDTFDSRTSRAKVSAISVRAALRMASGGVKLRAPDGMLIDPSALQPSIHEVPQTRSERISAGKTAEVPQRIQQGPTCGLYALGMVMDYWNSKDASNPSVLVSDKDLGGQGRNYNVEPTSDERMLTYVRDNGYTSAGEMFKARDLAETASHFGYSASLHQDATLEALYTVLDAGRPAIVAFDVDYRGNPGDFGGKRAHYAVIQGYFEEDGERYLIARHGWGGSKDYIWKAADFDQSWKALKSTDWYGTPGDGIMPDANYEEPKKLDLPDLGNGEAGIARSLGTKIIEVIPAGEMPTGGSIV
jgi:hypothetical protein